MAESERVVVRGDMWTVLSRTAFRGCEALRLEGAGAANGGITRTVLVPFDRPRPLDRCSTLRAVRPRRLLHALRALAVRATPYGALGHVDRSDIELLPFQVEPALSMLRHGRARVLIADEVGLGKTVQAGLILNELAAVADSFRGLVICPAGLREQWAGELSDRFALDSTTADASWLARAVREHPPDVNPWVLPGIYISSFDFVKRPEVLRPLEEVAWDALVIDEAHLASSSSHRRAAVHSLGRRSRRIVLLSATPHAGDAGQFDALCRIGAGAEPITVFHRSRREVGSGRVRKTVVFVVRTSDAERLMHRLVASYTARLAREADARGDSTGRLVAIVLRKRSLSSAGSLASSARRRLVRLASVAPESTGHQMLLPLDEEPLDDEEPDAVLGAPGLADPAAERCALAAIASAAHAAARGESKAGFLLRLLARTKESIIVFTEYRDTLARLEGLVRRAGHEPAVLHGGLTAAERSRVQRRFNEHAGILLATDAASEGLNLHHRCRVVLHYELPWSPVRLEQRTGRVDRFGQRRTVHELMLVANHTAERLVLAPLARRAAAADASLPGSGSLARSLTEFAVARIVLDGDSVETAAIENAHGRPGASGPRALAAGVRVQAAGFRIPESGGEATCEATPRIEFAELRFRAEADDEVRRLELLRAWQSATSRRTPFRQRLDRPVVTCLRSRSGRLPAGVLGIYTVALRAGAERVVDSIQVCIQLPWQWTGLRKAANALQAARSWLGRFGGPVAERLRRFVDDRMDRVRPLRDRALAATRERERLIACEVPSEARRLVQASLFNRRAIRDHEARQEAARTLTEEVNRRLEALERSRRLVPEVTLSAVMLVE